jgi:hypothetical protein
LKKAGVSPKVIAAMIESSPRGPLKSNGGEPQAPLAAGTARVVSVRTLQTYSQDEDGAGSTKVRQVYRLETVGAVYEVTGWEHTGFYGLGGKAGKRPALQIGEIVNYRVDPKQTQFIEILLTDSNGTDTSA